MNIDLTDEETAALLRELDSLIDGDRYFMSQRIKTLKAIRAKIRPEPAGAVASATEAICTAADDIEAETGREALSCPDDRQHPAITARVLWLIRAGCCSASLL